jgi:hypothetical protein
MTAYKEQFDQFWKIIDGVCELPPELKETFTTAWNKITWPVSTGSVGGAPATHAKVVKGYNVFITETVAELKTNKQLTGKDRMKEATTKWGQLTPEQQKTWNDKASAMPVEMVGTKTKKSKKNPSEKKPRAMSGYNLYIKQVSPIVKGKISSADRMSGTAQLWKLLSPDIQNQWKEAAKSGQDPPPIDAEAVIATLPSLVMKSSTKTAE